MRKITIPRQQTPASGHIVLKYDKHLNSINDKHAELYFLAVATATGEDVFIIIVRCFYTNIIVYQL